MKHRWAVILLVGFLVSTFQADALVIKVGSVAPEGSPWDKALKRIALDWQKISGGRVTMKHLSHSTRRELQKMGRLPREEDLGFE